MANRLWVLGAADPELVAIEGLLTAANERFVYAVGSDGKRVHPGNAYKAEWPKEGDGATLFVVECGFASPEDGSLSNFSGLVVIDHHRPGDPGYGRKPEEFLRASSLGQVIQHLASLGKGEVVRGTDGREGVSSESLGLFFWPEEQAWMCCIRRTDRSADVGGQSVYIRKDLVLAAAADHCLRAAYANECPGVNPDELMRWRVESRSAFQGRTVDEVLADIKSASLILINAVSGRGDPIYAPSDGYDGAYLTGDIVGFGSAEYADLRGRDIPELPEAAARTGIPFLATMSDRDGRKKVVLQAASPELVTRFLAGQIIPNLDGLYGDPARGFAGGYLS